MAQLFSRYVSGIQLTAGAIAGSVLGASGLNPIVDRLNSIATSDNLLTGSILSGTTTNIYASFAKAASFQTALGSFTDEVNFAGPVHYSDTIDTTNHIYMYGNGRSLQIYSGAINFLTAGSIIGEKAMFQLENRTADPASPSMGRMWIRTDL